MQIDFLKTEAEFKPVEIKIIIETKEELDILDLYFDVSHGKQVELINGRLNDASKKSSNFISSILDPIYHTIQKIKHNG